MAVDFWSMACLHCSQPALAPASKDQIFCVAEYRFRIRVDVIQCKACEKVYLTTASQEKMERTIASFLAEEAGNVGSALRFMRLAIGLTTTEAGMALGVPAEAFEICENDGPHGDPRIFSRFKALVAMQVGPRRRQPPPDSRSSIRVDLRTSLS